MPVSETAEDEDVPPLVGATYQSQLSIRTACRSTNNKILTSVDSDYIQTGLRTHDIGTYPL